MSIVAKKANKDDEAKLKSQSGSDKGYSYEVKEMPESIVELFIKVGSKRFGTAKEKAYQKLADQTSVAGFRKGKAPRNLIEAKLGARLFEEAIQQVVPEITALVMVETKLQPLSQASYTIKKFSNDDGLEFSAIFSIQPKIELPDFSKLTVEKEKVEVADDEVNSLFDKLKSDIIASEKAKAETEEESSTSDTSESKSSKPKSKKKKISDEDIIIDWGKELGNEKLKTDDDVKVELKNSLVKRKEMEANEKFDNSIVEKSIEFAQIEAPSHMFKPEADLLEKNYISRIEKLGLKVEDFLKSQKTTLEEQRKNWEKDAKFKVAADLLFVSVINKNKFEVTDKEVKNEIDGIQDPEMKKNYDTPQGHNVIRSVIFRQKALKYLREAVQTKEIKPKQNPKTDKKTQAPTKKK